MGDYDLTDDEQVKQYLQNIETEYSYQCLSEKEPDGCHRLADFMYTIRKNEQVGLKLFKSTCDLYKYGHSCFKYAGPRYLGKGLEVDKEEGISYFEKACEAGFTRGCSNAGFLHLEGSDKPDYDKGIRLLAKACELNEAEACQTLGTAYMTAKYDIEKDAKRGSLLLKRACELGSYAGCMNASRMYRIGDNVDKSTILAAKFHAMAQKIRETEEPTKSGVRLGRGAC